jgi:hypothetical protein
MNKYVTLKIYEGDTIKLLHDMLLKKGFEKNKIINNNESIS